MGPVTGPLEASASLSVKGWGVGGSNKNEIGYYLFKFRTGSVLWKSHWAFCSGANSTLSGKGICWIGGDASTILLPGQVENWTTFRVRAPLCPFHGFYHTCSDSAFSEKECEEAWLPPKDGREHTGVTSIIFWAHHLPHLKHISCFMEEVRGEKITWWQSLPGSAESICHRANIFTGRTGNRKKISRK